MFHIPRLPDSSYLGKYECLLGLPLTETPPYFYKGHYPSWSSIARLVKVLELEMIRRKLNQNGVEGLPQKYLEDRVRHFLDKDDWSTFLDVLGVIVYGIILFPDKKGKNMACCKNLLYLWLTAHMFHSMSSWHVLWKISMVPREVYD
ncbi:hypothetical protein CR513_40439, partial [Mucuna pruriens]